MGRSDQGSPKRELDASKKCPYCSSYVKLSAERCDSCHRRIGPANEYGVAKKPFNFTSYLTAILAVGGFVAYLIWAFGK